MFKQLSFLNSISIDSSVFQFCRAYEYWDARNFLLDQMKDQSCTVLYKQIIEIYFTVYDFVALSHGLVMP